MELYVGPMIIEKVDTATPCIRLERVASGAESRGGGGAGTGIQAIVLELTETTADTNFWGTAATCIRFDVIFRRRG